MSSEYTTKEEQRIALLNLRKILNLDAGEQFFRFLLKEFDILGSPPPLLKPEQMIEEVAYRRMGGTISDYISKADPQAFGRLMMSLSKEKHDEYFKDETPNDSQPE